MKTEVELRQLSLDHDKMGEQIHHIFDELIQSNKLLREEIVRRQNAEVEILEITQAEQIRVGMLLHDGICQELSGILLFAKSLAQKMERDKGLELAELKKISDMLLTTVDKARDTARGLYPGEMSGSSLIHALEDLVAKCENVACSFHCPEPIVIDDNLMAAHLYRIAQEGVSNALKHAKARHIELSFTRHAGKIILAIKDDGVGLSGDTKQEKGIGMKIMKNRSRMLGGVFQMKSNTPQGVILECVFSIPEKTKGER